MSLYKEKKIDLGNKKPLIIGIIVFIVIIIIALIAKNISFNIEPEAIEVDFTNDPLRLSKAENTDIEINVRNITEFDQENINLKIKAVENVFTVKCLNNLNSVQIPILSKNNERKVICSIIPIIERSKIFEGTYAFDIMYSRNNIVNTKRASLRVEK